MKNLIAITIGFLIATMPLALAQETIATQVTDDELAGTQAGTTPDSWTYGFKRFAENIQLFLTFDELQKAKLHYNLAKVRLAEAAKLAKENKMDLAEKATKEYEDGLTEVNTRMEKAVAAGKNITDLSENVNDETYKHILVLKRVYEKVPAKAKIALGNVIEKVLEKRSEAVKRVEDKELVSITITVGNKTITKEVPAKLAERFLERADELKEKVKDEVNISQREKLKEAVSDIAANKAAEKLEEARLLVDQALEKREETNLTAYGLINEAKAHLEKAEKAFNETKYGEAFGQATAASAQARAALKIQNVKERVEEKKEEIKEKAKEAIDKIKEKIQQRKTNKTATNSTS